MNASLQAFVQAVESGLCTGELAATFGIDRITVRRRAIKLGLTVKRSGKEGRGRPVPSDFAQQCQALTRSKLIKHYTASDETVARWLRETGLKPAKHIRSIAEKIARGPAPERKPKQSDFMKYNHRNKFGRPQERRPVPDDFAKVASGLYISHVARHYHASFATVQRWEELSGVACKRVTEMGPPAEFAEIAPTLEVRELAARYKRNDTTVRQWCKDLGVKPKSRRIPYTERKQFPKGYMGHPERWSDMPADLYQMFMRWPAAVWSAEEWEQAYA